ncbi:restriction endonuclease [Leptolyngbya sp. Heron Island J]|uniref:restriction endonuclease n=1 Tax=Leptolyngbya sp. Heron Island J TaxID=1385935 RepID=UPI0003B96F54|nr:restriction endonuclease [Leptolyngbya sp. Heron Island J]ESA37160.1 restriction endonuclease [Leptolyngbya sp. Heron Island J]
MTAVADQAFQIPSWVWKYKPKRLKRPVDGRVFQVPTQKQAMKNARIILQRIRKDYAHLTLAEKTPSILEVLRVICPFVYEAVLLTTIDDHGWRIMRSCFTHDGGIDGTFFLPTGEKFLIQAKRYRGEIDPEHVIALASVVHREKAQGGVFIHTGFTCTDSRFVEELAGNITIIDGEDLVSLVME